MAAKTLGFAWKLWQHWVNMASPQSRDIVINIYIHGNNSVQTQPQL